MPIMGGLTGAIRDTTDAAPMARMKLPLVQGWVQGTNDVTIGGND